MARRGGRAVAGTLVTLQLLPPRKASARPRAARRPAFLLHDEHYESDGAVIYKHALQVRREDIV